MTVPGPSPAAEPPYSGPPPTGSYRAPPQLPPGYPPPYPPHYPPPYRPDGPPGTALAAAVIGWVLAGLLFLSAGLLFFGATFLHDLEVAGDYHSGYAVELALDGVLDLLAGGLLVAGGVALTARNAYGRPLLVAGSSLVVVLSLYWLIRWSDRVTGAIAGYAVVFGAGAVLITGFVSSRRVSAWLAARR